MPINAIVVDEQNGIYVGADVGIYYRNDSIGNWIPFSQDLPNTIITDLELLPQKGKILAATYGRGIWESDVFNYAGSISLSRSLSTAFFYESSSNSTVKFNNWLDEIGKVDIPNTTIERVKYILFDFLKQPVLEFLEGDSTKVAALPNGIYYIGSSEDNYKTPRKFIKSNF